MLTVFNGMWAVFAAFARMFAAWPQVALAIFSLVTAVLALVVWKYFSNQKGITRAKDLIKANFLAMVLFGDSLGVLLGSIARTFGWIFVYLARQMVPLVLMMIPILPMLVQVDNLYSFSPIVIDETGKHDAAEVEVVAVVDPTVNLFDLHANLTADAGVKTTTDGVRIPFPQHPKSDWEQWPLIGGWLRDSRLEKEPPSPEVHWRINGQTPGEHTLTIAIGEHQAQKSVIVTEPDKLKQLFPITRKRHRGGFGDSFEFPGETALTGAIQSVEILYPRRDGWWHWILIYLIETLIVAFALKGPMKVDF